MGLFKPNWMSDDCEKTELAQKEVERMWKKRKYDEILTVARNSPNENVRAYAVSKLQPFPYKDELIGIMLDKGECLYVKSAAADAFAAYAWAIINKSLFGETVSDEERMKRSAEEFEPLLPLLDNDSCLAFVLDCMFKANMSFAVKMTTPERLAMIQKIKDETHEITAVSFLNNYYGMYQNDISAQENRPKIIPYELKEHYDILLNQNAASGATFNCVEDRLCSQCGGITPHLIEYSSEWYQYQSQSGANKGKYITHFKKKDVLGAYCLRHSAEAAYCEVCKTYVKVFELTYADYDDNRTVEYHCPNCQKELSVK